MSHQPEAGLPESPVQHNDIHENRKNSENRYKIIENENEMKTRAKR